jgi:hypothetical protein
VLARLDRDRPDLAMKVRVKDLSANAVAIQAGFRKKHTRFEQVVKWIPDLTSAEKRALIKLMEAS